MNDQSEIVKGHHLEAKGKWLSGNGTQKTDRKHNVIIFHSNGRNFLVLGNFTNQQNKNGTGGNPLNVSTDFDRIAHYIIKGMGQSKGRQEMS